MSQLWAPPVRLATDEEQIAVWDLPAGKERGNIVVALDALVPQPAFTPDSRTLAITMGKRRMDDALMGGTLGVWDLDRAQWLGNGCRGHLLQ